MKTEALQLIRSNIVDVKIQCLFVLDNAFEIKGKHQEDDKEKLHNLCTLNYNLDALRLQSTHAISNSIIGDNNELERIIGIMQKFCTESLTIASSQKLSQFYSSLNDIQKLITDIIS